MTNPYRKFVDACLGVVTDADDLESYLNIICGGGASSPPFKRESPTKSSKTCCAQVRRG
jgi:hypothetical protein